MSKVKAQTRHALRRAYERYGLRLTGHDYQALVGRIQRGNAQFVVAQSNRVSVFDLTYTTEEGAIDTPIRVVYDKHRKTIVTFLHPDQGYV